MRSLVLITLGSFLTLLLVRDIRAGGEAYMKGTSSRAFRVCYWCLISGLMAGGLFGYADERLALALVMLGALAGGAWILGVVLIMIVAPTYAARIVYYPMSVALRHHPFAAPPSLARAEREARVFSYLMVGLAVVGACGYFVWTRWLGVWTVLTGYLIVLAILCYQILGRKKPWTGWSLAPTAHANMLKDDHEADRQTKGDR